ncbi:MAG: hypothetical protein ABS939_10795 [Psychrobacillus sp.]
MTRRKLTDEELEAISNKEWKQTPIFSSDEKLVQRAKNLTGPKTAEGKKRALANLQVGRNSSDSPTNLRHGGYIKKILNEDEQEYYFARQEKYLKDYDINSSADEITLHTALMEEVILMRLYTKQANNPSIDIERPLNDCTRRLRTALEDLGALRKQRLKQDDKVASLNIATIAQQFARELMQGSVEDELKKLREEEEKFLETRTKDINDNYVVVEEDEDGEQL